MNAKRLFEDDEILFGNAFDDRDPERDSHVELKVDRVPDAPSTEPDLEAVTDFGLLVPYLTVSIGEVSLLPLDHREGFILSRVDGRSTIETILDVCAMPADEALDIIESLVERGIIDLR
jgi:hypothetical protein